HAAAGAVRATSGQHCGQAVLAAGHHADRRPLVGQELGQCRADAGGCSGDEHCCSPGRETTWRHGLVELADLGSMATAWATAPVTAASRSSVVTPRDLSGW